MLVDTAHQHIFFSQGAGSTDIVVTDLSGTPVTTIAGEQGATGLALSADGSTLYAALTDGDALSAIDTATLSETTRVPTGTDSAPVSVAVAGGKVWYGYTDAAAGGKGAIGSVDPAAAEPAATPQPTMDSWSVAPVLAAGGEVLAAEVPMGNLSHVATFDVSSGTATAKANLGVYGGTATGLQVTGDGARLLLAAPQSAALQAYRTADLASASPSVYYTGGVDSAPNSLAVDTDGTIAVGSTAGSAAGLYLYAGSQLAENHVTFPSGTLAPDGLEWGGDGTTLYAVTKDSAGAYTLDVLAEPKLADTELALNYPQYAVPTQQFTVTGTLSTKGWTPTGESLKVTRDGEELPDVTATLDKNGSFAVTDTRPDAGAYTYEVTYPGDATHRPSTASLTVHVAKLSTTIPFPDMTSATPDSVAFTGSLTTSLNLGSLPQGTTVQVSPDERGHTGDRAAPVGPGRPGDNGVQGHGRSGRRGQVHLPPLLRGRRDTRADLLGRDRPGLPVHPGPDPQGARDGDAGRGAELHRHADRRALRERRDGDRDAHGRRTHHNSGAVDERCGCGRHGDGQGHPEHRRRQHLHGQLSGDASHQAATASAIVQVSRVATTVSVATNASTYTYGATGTVTAHLGTTYNSRTVSIWATPAGGTKTLVKTGAVDSKGNLTATYRLTHNTTFTASFAGDYRYAPKSATRTVNGQVRVATTLGGYYGNVTYNGTPYRVYHHTVKPQVVATVTPDKSGQCAKFQAQEYYGGAWHTLTTSPCFSMAPGSVGVTHLSLTNAVNQRFRVRAEYVRSAKDTTNVSTWGGWLYLTVRN